MSIGEKIMTILIKELSDAEFQVTVNAKNQQVIKWTLTDDIHQNLTMEKSAKGIN